MYYVKLLIHIKYNKNSLIKILMFCIIQLYIEIIKYFYKQGINSVTSKYKYECL